MSSRIEDQTMYAVRSLQGLSARAVIHPHATTTWQRTIGQIAYYLLFLTALSFAMLLPLLWMISGSLKARSQIFAYPPEWLTDPLVWQNYVDAWTTYPFDMFTFNSLKISLLVVFGRLLFCSMGGLRLSRSIFR